MTRRPVNERFAEALYAARQAKGWSTFDLERACSGFNYSMQYRIRVFEEGHDNPSLRELEALADALGVTTDTLLGRDKP